MLFRLDTSPFIRNWRKNFFLSQSQLYYVVEVKPTSMDKFFFKSLWWPFFSEFCNFLNYNSLFLQTNPKFLQWLYNMNESSTLLFKIAVSQQPLISQDFGVFVFIDLAKFTLRFSHHIGEKLFTRANLKAMEK